MFHYIESGCLLYLRFSRQSYAYISLISLGNRIKRRLACQEAWEVFFAAYVPFVRATSKLNLYASAAAQVVFQQP